MPWIPEIGCKVKLRTFDEYSSRRLPLWAWLQVIDINNFVVMLKLLDESKPLAATHVTVPVASIEAPIGWSQVYEVTVPGCREKFITWIKDRGGVAVWANHNLSNPGAGNMYTPAMTDDKPTEKPSWSVGYVETVRDSSRFKFIKEWKEIKRVKIALRRRGQYGQKIELTDASDRKVRKALDEHEERTGEKAYYVFDELEAVIQSPRWE